MNSKKKKLKIYAVNRKIIDKILDELRTTYKARDSTYQNYKVILEKLADFLGNKSIKKATERDIRKFHSIRSKEVKDSTMQSQFSFLKKSYRILFGYRKRFKYPKCIDWLSLSLPVPEKELRESDMWTSEDVEKIIKKTESPMETALIKALAESGCRINELLGLQLRDVTMTQNKAYLHISRHICKTKVPRTVELVKSVPELRVWLSYHPSRNGSAAFLFPIKENAVRSRLKKLAEKAEIDKPVCTKIFRHSRANFLHRNGVPKPVIDKMMGWKKGSRMFELHYGHFSDKTVSEWNNRINGLSVPEEKPLPLKLSEFTCNGCGFQLPLAGIKYCPNCGKALKLKDEMKSLEKAQKIEFEKIKIMEKLMREANEQRQEISKLNTAICGLTMHMDIKDATKEQNGKWVNCSHEDFKRMEEKRQLQLKEGLKESN